MPYRVEYAKLGTCKLKDRVRSVVPHLRRVSADPTTDLPHTAKCKGQSPPPPFRYCAMTDHPEWLYQDPSPALEPGLTKEDSGLGSVAYHLNWLWSNWLARFEYLTGTIANWTVFDSGVLN